MSEIAEKIKNAHTVRATGSMNALYEFLVKESDEVIIRLNNIYRVLDNETGRNCYSILHMISWTMCHELKFIAEFPA